MWNPVLNDLIPLFAGLYPDSDRTRSAVRRAGLDPADLDLTGAPKVVWLRVVEEADRQSLIDPLLDVVQSDFPRIQLAPLRARLAQPPTAAPPIVDAHWKAAKRDGATLEKVTGKQPTFLPISFLKAGLTAARAVCCLRSPVMTGSGFLIQDDLLLTNHHVFPDVATAASAVAWFNYEKSSEGLDQAVTEYRLLPDQFFATCKEFDWTAVRIEGDPGKTWGTLQLSAAELKTDDFVNIVQHPSGLPKQIALYHNLVVYADRDKVQYLTDTLPGSSGSPVFNQDWRVVALHHSGGWIPEPGGTAVFFRNEGIHAARLLSELRGRGVAI